MIAIVGGGPAGSFVAENFAKNGEEVMLFDHSHPREKICQGILPIDEFTKNIAPDVKHMEFDYFIANKQICQMPLRTYMRKDLDLHLFKKAGEAGAELIKDKIISIEESNTKFILEGLKETYDAKYVVGADGVHSIVRKTFFRPFKPERLGNVTVYYSNNKVGGVIELIFDDFGAFFSCPRPDGHTISRAGNLSETWKTKELLDELIKKKYPNFRKTREGTAPNPTINARRHAFEKVSLKRVALIGDAAGFGDNVFGDGIYPALRAGKLLPKHFKNTGSFHGLERVLRAEYYKRYAVITKLRKRLGLKR